MPKVTEQHLEARRQQILAAATACFARKGFHGCTVHDICEQASLSPGAVYRYFDGKEAIIEAICDDFNAHNLELLRAAGEREDTLQALQELAGAFFAQLDDARMRALDAELWAETQRNPHIRRMFAESLHAHRDAIASVLRRAQGRGELDPSLDAEVVARVMISFFEGLALQKLVDEGADTGSYLDVMLRMIEGLFVPAGD